MGEDQVAETPQGGKLAPLCALGSKSGRRFCDVTP